MAINKAVYKDGVLVSYEINGVPQRIEDVAAIIEQIQEVGLVHKIKNATTAARQAIRNPSPVSEEERERRLGICHACEFLIDGKRCAKCGCNVSWKTRLEAWHCPIQKW